MKVKLGNYPETLGIVQYNAGAGVTFCPCILRNLYLFAHTYTITYFRIVLMKSHFHKLIFRSKEMLTFQYHSMRKIAFRVFRKAL